MVLDYRPERRTSPPGQGRSAKRLLVIALSSVFAIALLVSAGVFVKSRASGKTVSAVLLKPPKSGTYPPKSGTQKFSPPKSWALKFNATFPGSSLDSPGLWSTCYPWWTTDGCTNYGNPSDPELEWYKSSQDQVSGGVLHLVAQREPTPGLDKQGNPKEYACRSGMVTTYPSLRFEYGYIQITAKIPFGKGLWPAFWLAAANEKWPPEVDILEHWHSEPYGKVYLHPLSGARQGGAVSMPDLSAGWHTFGLYWTKTRLAWYYDGTQVLATSTGVPRQDMYLIANLAVDNASPGGCSGSLLIKSVKVWQPLH